MGWGQTVVDHLPWGALSGSPRVRGHERVFWGRCGGFRAPVVQYMHCHAKETVLELRGVLAGGVAERGTGDGAGAGEALEACRMDSGSTISVSALESHAERKSIHAAVAPPEDEPWDFDDSVIRPVSSARKTLRSVD